MFGYDTTPGFVVGVAIAQLFNFAIMAWWVLFRISLCKKNACGFAIFYHEKKNNLNLNFENGKVWEIMPGEKVLRFAEIKIRGPFFQRLSKA